MFRRGYTGPPVQVRNLPESDDRPHASADPPHSAAHATSGHHALRLRTGSKKLRRGRDGPSTVSLPPCSRVPTVATYSPNRRTTETRHMNRTRPSGIRLCERHTRNAPPVPFRAEAGATRARPNHTLYDASRQTDVRSPDFDRSIDCRPIWPTFDWQLLY